MSDTYHKNLAVLKLRYPGYAEILEALPAVTLDLEDVKLNEKQAPGFVEAIAAEDPDRNCRIAIFLGVYYGLELLYYGSVVSPKKSTLKVIAIEHDPLQFKKALHAFDLAEIIGHPSMQIILTSTTLFKDITDVFVKDSIFYNLGAFKLYYNFEYFEAHKITYLQVVDVLRHSVNYSLMHYGNDGKDSIIGIRNMLENYHEISDNPGVNLLKDAFTGVPAVCIAAGPSLDKNIKLIKSAVPNAVIFAVDAALKPLLDQGIRPHFVTSLEREIEVVSLFKDIKEDLTGIYLAACPVVFNEVYQAYSGPRLIVYRQFDHFKWLMLKRGMLPIKASPGNMSFTMAEYMGCNPIILVGQDLAIDGTKTNVAGTEHPEGYSDTYLNEPQFEVKGNYQDKVITTRSLSIMLDGFNCDVPAYKGVCINATEGGAYIEGTKIMTLIEALTGYCLKPQNIPTTIEHHLKQLKDPKDKVQLINIRVNKTLKHFKKCIGLADKALNHLNNKTYEPTLILDIKNSMSASSVWQLYFMHVAQSVIIGAEIKNLGLKNLKDIPAEELKDYFLMIKGLLQICIKDLNNFKTNILERG
jgi:hypothetical protein